MLASRQLHIQLRVVPSTYLTLSTVIPAACAVPVDVIIIIRMYLAPLLLDHQSVNHQGGCTRNTMLSHHTALHATTRRSHTGVASCPLATPTILSAPAHTRAD